MPTAPYIVLLNAKAGTSPEDAARDDAGRIAAAFAAHGATADVRLVPGPDLADAARAAAAERPAAVVAAGGDGTQSAVAGAMAGAPGGAPMGVLPMGTLNHFAKDLGVPLDLEPAVGAIVRGRPTPVDVAEVNGRVFVNNASIGLYPHVVRRRDQIREELGHGKWYAMLKAFLAVFRRFPVVGLRMDVNGQTWHRTTPFVFVGNNQYQIETFDLGSRARLDEGVMCLYFTNRTGRLGMLWLAARALFGRLKQAKDFNALCAREVWIDTHRKAVPVGMDGEVVTLAPPLHFRVRAGGLTVVLAPKEATPPPPPG